MLSFHQSVFSRRDKVRLWWPWSCDSFSVHCEHQVGPVDNLVLSSLPCAWMIFSGSPNDFRNMYITASLPLPFLKFRSVISFFNLSFVISFCYCLVIFVTSILHQVLIICHKKNEPICFLFVAVMIFFSLLVILSNLMKWLVLFVWRSSCLQLSSLYLFANDCSSVCTPVTVDFLTCCQFARPWKTVI